jgi:hypothetical protein
MGEICADKEFEETIELYFTAHPRSPSAMLRPSVFFRDNVWVALLGPSIKEGIVGLGSTTEAALHAFDAQYRGISRPDASLNGSWMSDAL